ncbi:YegS/Rv2252/BmrU family lipid kinase [Candidatus Haliotispira prima]|uniref:YegS/Rv2252/BmrU family lipid kinase n=1 Tax=Candidatus Haliotispira prima TaxID=3034016 RepID=A0ABY8MIK7_9SPIO|nr:YegS/Rv2252/BmrU family lipid kinase [Candidatus Haliotispira prima]
MKTKIIYNPKSGKRSLQPLMSYVIEQLSEGGCRNVEVYPTRAAGDATEAARDAHLNGCDLVIAVGGDGTVSEVVNGLASFGRPVTNTAKRPILGYIPSGTSNDFASALSIPTDVRKAVRIITKGHRANIDIGSINGQRSFNYIVAAGAFTRLTYTTPHHLKRVLGVWAYLKDIFREIPLIQKPFRLQLSIDGQQISGEYVIALVINSPNFAGMRKVIPHACMDDGIFDILLLPKSNPKVLWSAVRSMAMGVNESTTESGILHLRGKKISIEAEKRLDWNIDGEHGGRNPIKIECQEKYLQMMVPAMAMHKVLSHQDHS